MFLKKSTRKNTGRTHLSIVQGYWDNSSKQSRTKTIKTLGYLDDLQKLYADPIAHFENVVADMNRKQMESNALPTLSIDLNERINTDSTNRKNFGYAALSKIYHELGLHTFLVNRQRNVDINYSLNNIMKLLVFSRMLNPASKRKTFEEKDLYFENTDFSLDDVYRSLSLINKHKEALQLWIHQRICERYGRNTELVYYDVTNYYFEIDEPDELRKKGVSKEHRPDPIVQMGLFMDTMGLPISYRLFPGNETDKTTLIPMLAELTREYNLGRVIVVADKGLNTARNIYYNTHGLGNGYVLSQTVRGAHKELKDFVFNEEGYVWQGKDYKMKSRLYPREITITAGNGKPKKVRIDEKQVVFYSRDYDKRAKAEREPAVVKALELVRDPAKYNKATSYGAAKYVKNLVFDKDTGEILTSKQKPVFDAAKLREEEKFDGYYAIVTSEWKKSDEEIIEIYRGLWRIEESFKVTKSDLEARPVYLSRNDHIEAHFLTCFIALVIARLIQHRIGDKYSVARILESLKKVSCAHIKENYYLFDYTDEVTDAIGPAVGIDFSKKFMRLKDIKNILGGVKKG